MTKSHQNTDVAQAAANWANMGLEIELLANGAPIQESSELSRS